MTIMSIPFPRATRILQTDSSQRNILVLLFVVSFFALWTAWSVSSRVTLYAATTTARLEVDRERHPVGAPVGGRVVAVGLAVGKLVKAGDILLELDAIAEHLARNEEEVRLAPAASQIELVKLELAAEQRALEEDRRGAEATVAEQELRAQQSAAAAALSADEAGRVSSLRQRGLVSELEALRARNMAEGRESEARSVKFASLRLAHDFEVREQDRLAQIARLQREVAALEGTRGEAQARSDRLEHDIEQRTVRAPVSGTLAEVSPLTIGSMVAQGERICTIVPDGDVKVVAFFDPTAALGRVHAGQRARVRIEAFPWTQYGSASARVRTVASEPHDGQIRVDLALDQAHGSSLLPIEHGLPAEVDVEVDHVSPLALVLRSVAARTRVAAMQP